MTALLVLVKKHRMLSVAAHFGSALAPTAMSSGLNSSSAEHPNAEAPCAGHKQTDEQTPISSQAIGVSYMHTILISG